MRAASGINSYNLQMEDGYYRVCIRRDLGLEIRKEAQDIEGAGFWFEVGWIIEDLKHYAGETAMLPRDERYPPTAPTWIASGDLFRMNGWVYTKSKSIGGVHLPSSRLK